MTETEAMTVEEYCAYLGWSIQQLMRESGIDSRSASKAHKGQPISGNTKQKIALAIGKAMGKVVQVGEIQW